MSTVALAGCGQDEDDGGARDRASAPTGQEAAPGSGAEDETADPGAISETVQGFGGEAAPAHREETVAVLRTYFSALAVGRHGAACSLMASSFRRTLWRALQPDRARWAGCRALGRMLSADPDLPVGEAAAAARARVLEVRLAGRNAVVIYRPEAGEVSFLTLIRERAGWKATSLAGAPLP